MVNYTKQVWDKVSKMNISHNFILGPINAESLLKDPKHLAFSLSRYKFSAKMLHNCKHIIELGCGEGIGVLAFLKETSACITAIDFDQKQIEYAKANLLPFVHGRVKFICNNIITGSYKGKKADGLACIDVIEHIHSSEEKRFFSHCLSLLKKDGVAIFGTPNKFASKYASPRSRKGHINLFTPERFTFTLENYFKRVFLFSMNDEMIHTGYNKLAHYLVALCVK